MAMATDSRQALDVLGVILRNLWAFPVALVLAALVAAGAYFSQQDRPDLYESNALLLLRTPGNFAIQYPDQQSLTIQNTNRSESPEFLPRPLGVEEVAVLLQSDVVLSAVREAYIKKNTDQPPPDLPTIRGCCSLTTRQELKTPYDVRYSSAITLTTASDTPERARDLAEMWVEAGTRLVHEANAQVREAAYACVDQEYARAMQQASMDPLMLRALAALRVQTKLAKDYAAPELQVFSAPLAGTLLPQKDARLFPAVAFLVGFFAIYLGLILLLLVRDARRKILAAPSA